MPDIDSYFRLDPERIDRILLPGCDTLQIFLKREDLIHPFVSGNKWRKLKYNFLEAQRLGKARLVTFGGAYSNHLVAVACASAALGFQSAAFVRGESPPANKHTQLGHEPTSASDSLSHRMQEGGGAVPPNPASCDEPMNRRDIPTPSPIGWERAGVRVLVYGKGQIDGKEAPLNHMLRLCAAFGMELIPVSRTDYRNKENLLQRIKHQDAFIIPEGGTNELAVRGVAEAATAIHESFDHWVVPVGTGGTLAGLATCAAAHFPKTKVEGIAVVKAATSLDAALHQLAPTLTNVNMHHQFTHGGYGKTNKSLNAFCDHFTKGAGILIEPIYSGKMLWAVSQLAQAEYFKKGARILCFHTGGLLGSRVFSQISDPR